MPLLWHGQRAYVGSLGRGDVDFSRDSVGLPSLGDDYDVAAIDARDRTLKEAVALHGFPNGAFNRELRRLKATS